MKRKNMTIGAGIAAIIFILAFTACNNGGPTRMKSLTSIAVTTLPTKTAYIIGEDFNPAGMVVTAAYDDGSTAIVAGYTLDGFDSAAAGNKTVMVTFEGNTDAFTVTVRQAESFAITFAQLADAAPEIEGPFIYLLDREGKPTVATVTLSEPEQYDSGSIKWHVNGVVTPGDTVTLRSSDLGRVGEYFITVEVIKDGIPYNKTVSFTVAL